MFTKISNSRLSALGSPASNIVDNIIANAKKFGDLPNALIKELSERESIVSQLLVTVPDEAKIEKYFTDFLFVHKIPWTKTRDLMTKALGAPVNGANVEFWSEPIPIVGINDIGILTTKTIVPIVSSIYPNYVKYFVDFKYNSSNLNFLYNYNSGGNDNITVNITSSSAPYVVDIELGSPLTYGMSFSKYGTLNNFLFYYMSESGKIKTVNVSRNKTGSVNPPDENDINGYAPVEIFYYDPNQSRILGFTSMANIDNSMYALVETCA
jgi:hypothetical protein